MRANETDHRRRADLVKLVRIDAFDDDEKPTEATFTCSVDELALIYNVTGTVAPVDIEKVGGSYRWVEANEEVASAISSFFNRFWDNGVEECAPRWNVEKLYEAKRDRQGER